MVVEGAGAGALADGAGVVHGHVGSDGGSHEGYVDGDVEGAGFGLVLPTGFGAVVFAGGAGVGGGVTEGDGPPPTPLPGFTGFGVQP